MDCIELFQGIARNTLSSTGIILDTNFLVFAENFFQCLCFSKGFMTRGDSGVATGDEEGRYQATVVTPARLANTTSGKPLNTLN